MAQVARSLSIVALVFASCEALAFGPWLELTPLGGVEVGGEGALDRAALDAKLDGLAAA